MLPQIQRVACYGLLIRESKLLLCRLSARSSAPGVWTLPGGGMEFGEHPEETLRREVKEETGFEIADPRLLTVWSEVAEAFGSSYHNLQFIYRADICGGDLLSETEGSTDMCEWLSREEAKREPLVRIVRQSLQILGSEI